MLLECVSTNFFTLLTHFLATTNSDPFFLSFFFLKNMTSRSFVFTLNNPLAFNVNDLEEDGPLHEDFLLVKYLRYVSYQFEVGSNGTEHFQGYAEFDRPVRVAALKVGQFARAHFQVRRGTRDQARDYSRKDETRSSGPWEFGTFALSPGKRTDLEEAATQLLEGRNLRELALQHPASYVKFHKGFAALLETTRPQPSFPEPLWRRWQLETLRLLQGPAHPREILWFVDPEGGTGKSYFVRYLAINLGALTLSSGRHDRLLHAFDGEPIVTFDFARDVSSESTNSAGTGDRTPYAVIEAIKNGNVFSGFFGAKPKIFNVPHVLCFSNFEPDRSKFSADRWNVRNLQSHGSDVDYLPGDPELPGTF